MNFRKISVVIMAVFVLFAFGLIGMADAGKPGGTTATTNLILGNPSKGMYCADPAGWAKGGYKIYVWSDRAPFQAQALDAGGHKITPATGIAYKVSTVSGSMSVTDATNKVFSASP